MLKKKFGIVTLVCLLCLCVAMLFAACSGTQGEKGDKGESGADGKDGISIVSVEKTDSEGLTDTYTITYSDGKTTIFTVTNGRDGSDGSDGEDGTDGESGKDGISITKVDINGSGELVISFSEGSPVNLGKIVGTDGVDGQDGKDGVSIEGATVDDSGNLILALSDDTTFTAGKVKGENGADGKDGVGISGVEINESGEIVISFTDGKSSNLGKIVGTNGKDGADGVGIDKIELDEEYNLTIYLTEGEPISLGCIRGEKGEDGADGKDGKSAYELYKEKFGYEGTEEQWLIDLANGNLAVVETHTVTFDAQGGSPEPEAQEVKHLGKASKPENPVKDGFLFDGWYYQGEKWSFVGYVVTEDMTLTAQWSEADSGCEITSAEGFEFGTEIIDENEVQTITRKVANATQSFNLAAAISVSDGCTWRLFADYAQSEEIASKMMTDLQTGDNIAWLVVYGESDQTLYKVNVYRRHIRNYTFQSEGETHTSGTIEEDHKLNVPETNPTNKAGYTFSHWTVDGKQVIFPYTVAVDTTFIAVFTPNNNPLHFNGNGATGGSMEDMTIATDASANLTANGYVRAGYTFKGWATSAGGEVVYADGATYTMGTESEYTLYAVWEANENTLHFDGNGATGGTTEDMTIASDETVTLISNGFEKTGYHFIGWATSADGEVEFTDENSYTMGTESEYTLYAVWEANINTLHFDKNDEKATGEMQPIQMKTDEVQNLPAVGFEKIGYHLKGWATSTDGKVEFTDKDSYTMGTESEYTLYAVWEANENTLHFDGNGATSGTMEDMTIATDATATLIPNGYERIGYQFIGWATSSDGEVKFSDEGSYKMGTESEYTLYAVWKVNVYTITYNTDGGTWKQDSNPSTFTVEDLPVKLTFEPVIKNDYAFMGWHAEEDFSGEAITEFAIDDIGDITFYAELLAGTEGLQYIEENGGYTVTDYTGTPTEIIIPDYHAEKPVLKIGDSAVRGISGLTSVIFGENSQLTSIGDSAFHSCSGLTNIDIPNSVTSIGDNAFDNCTNLTNVIFGKNSQLTSIGKSAFFDCHSLSSIEIPSGVTSMGALVFTSYYYNLKTIYYGGANILDWRNIEGIDNVPSSATIYYYSEEQPTTTGNYWHYVNGIPSKWEWGEQKIFHFETNGGNSIDDIVAAALTFLPTPVKEGYWFGGWYDNPECTGTAITVPYYDAEKTTLYAKWIETTDEGLAIINGVIVGIGTCDDTVLHIYLPIAENAFNNCSQITEVYLYDGCTYIGEQAFNSCSNLKSVYFMQTTMPEISSDVFANTWNSTTFIVFVPQDLYDEYAAVEDTYWQQYIVDTGKLYPME